MRDLNRRRKSDPERTQLRIEGVLLRSGLGIFRPSFWEDIAMKASLLFVAGLAIAISSIAPANAAPVHATANAPGVGCSWAGGWNFSSCKNVGNWKSYSECKEGAAKPVGETSKAGGIARVWGSRTNKITSRSAEAAPSVGGLFHIRAKPARLPLHEA